MSYQDQFTKAMPVCCVINTVREWSECEIDNGIQISEELAERAEYNACCIVNDFLQDMVSHD